MNIQQQPLTQKDLEQLGFTKDYDRVYEPEFSYESWTKELGDNYISMNFEFDLEGELTKQFLTVNDRDFAGRQATKQDLINLQELMQDLTLNTNF